MNFGFPISTSDEAEEEDEEGFDDDDEKLKQYPEPRRLRASSVNAAEDRQHRRVWGGFADWLEAVGWDSKESRSGLDILSPILEGLADHPDQGIATPNWTINVSDIKTVRINNVSLAVSKRDIEEFFSFSGDIQYVEMRSESETTQLAYVTFKDTQGSDTAILLSGAVIGNLSVSITPVDDYVIPPEAVASNPMGSSPASAMKAAEEVVSSMLAKGFILGKDAMNKAKSLDERHGLVANASATVASIDQRMGLTEKLSVVNERYQVTEKTRSALVGASHAVMGNPYVQSGASWLSSTLGAISRDVGAMTREKLERAEEEKKDVLYRERTGIVADFAHIHLDRHESSSVRGVGGPPVVPVSSADHNNPAVV